MELTELLDALTLDSMIRSGYVRYQDHPSMPLRIYNYTQRCQFDRAWNDVTRACRGLVVSMAEGDRGKVVARPWPKFHNYGEHEEGTLDLAAPVLVTDKLDGSLGIAYPTDAPGGVFGWAVATRGSFESDQALVATGLLMRYPFHPREGVTYLFEVIYPDNRIVVDYGGVTDLVLLGGVEIESGIAVAAAELPGWEGPRVKEMMCGTLEEALALEPRANAEGVVVQYLDRPCFLVKLKQDDYVALHRIVTGMNERTVWEMLSDLKTREEIKAPLPEEFWPWVDEVVSSLTGAWTERFAETLRVHEGVLRSLEAGWSRKEYALALLGATESRPHLRPWCFLVLDDRDPGEAIWRSLKPVRPRTLVDAAEASA